MYRIGVDVGGTFTDFTLLDEADGSVHFYKTASTPHDPSQAIETGLREMLSSLGFDAAAVTYLGHGTTVATNIVIERAGARTGLLTTKGFPPPPLGSAAQNCQMSSTVPSWAHHTRGDYLALPCKCLAPTELQ